MPPSQASIITRLLSADAKNSVWIFTATTRARAADCAESHVLLRCVWLQRIAPSSGSGVPVHHPPGSRGRAARAAGLRSGGSLGQDRLIARRKAHARTTAALLAFFSAKIEGDSVPVFDTGATNLFIVVPTLTVLDRWIFPKHVNREVEWRVPLSESGEV